MSIYPIMRQACSDAKHFFENTPFCLDKTERELVVVVALSSLAAFTAIYFFESYCQNFFLSPSRDTLKPPEESSRDKPFPPLVYTPKKKPPTILATDLSISLEDLPPPAIYRSPENPNNLCWAISLIGLLCVTGCYDKLLFSNPVDLEGLEGEKRAEEEARRYLFALFKVMRSQQEPKNDELQSLFIGFIESIKKYDYKGLNKAHIGKRFLESRALFSLIIDRFIPQVGDNYEGVVELRKSFPDSLFTFQALAERVPKDNQPPPQRSEFYLSMRCQPPQDIEESKSQDLEFKDKVAKEIDIGECIYQDLMEQEGTVKKEGETIDEGTRGNIISGLDLTEAPKYLLFTFDRCDVFTQQSYNNPISPNFSIELKSGERLHYRLKAGDIANHPIHFTCVYLEYGDEISCHHVNDDKLSQEKVCADKPKETFAYWQMLTKGNIYIFERLEA